MRRRAFLIGGFSGGVLLGCKPWAAPIAKPEVANEHELATLAAIADTFLPGDDGTPSASDTHAVATIVDPAYGLNPYVSEVVSDLDEWCLLRHHHTFVNLGPEQREQALEERMGMRGQLIKSLYSPAYEAMLALTKLAFFGGLANKLGTSWLAFPGPSTGYAPASAAGAWSSGEPPRALASGLVSSIAIAGNGLATSVHASVFATSPDDDARATLRITAPDGKRHDLALRAERGIALIDDARMPLVGGPAAGTWRLEVAAVAGGAGRFELWSLRLRTDLDDKVAR